jgi:DNA polymerase III delta subunit
MIYFLYGSDSAKARAKAHDLINGLLAKKPDASLFKFDSESFEPSEFDALSGGIGLFEKNHILFLDRVLENADAEEFVLSKLKDLEETPHICIMLEAEPKKAVREKIEKKAVKTQEFTLKEKAPKAEFNGFALADALGKRDKKELWSLYQEAQFEGKAPEELHGLLFWQVKSMLQASNSKSAQDSGLKPFVYGKALRYADNYSPLELKKKSSELVSIYHEARRGNGEFDIALEKFILGL